jgi:diaminohydroxyphosphoribosylaminopyrimidine deaminase / 5-amino-6-(5-phosphoribosylamino)uracil reductase
MATTTKSPFNAFDHAMMQLALRMAKRGLGTTAPNPSVGAVVADEPSGSIIAVGWTQPSGRPHAEAEALKRAGDRARGATMYVTLEPCAHTGRTPTCADQILTAGLARVVAAQPDPNAIIAGRGFDQIRAHGIKVDVGLMADAAQDLTLGHILRQTIKRPLVTVKLAMSRDGRIATGDGAPVWVTGPEARARGHLMRAEHDAILVGIKTVFADDPELTCRLPGLEHRSPQPVIVDNLLRLPLRAKVLQAQRRERPVLVATRASATEAAAEALRESGAVVLANLGDAPPGETPRVDLGRLMTELAQRGLTRILVEGGPTIAANVLDADLADEVAIFRSPDELGAAGIAALNERHAQALASQQVWTVIEQRALGRDLLTRYRRNR